MLSFTQYLTEQEDPEEGASRQIKHLTHAEDRPLQTGEKGAEHALSSLKAAAAHIQQGNNDSQMTTKYDGSPAIVYGHHPENGKFFVASKSAFNKTPKINYTEKDIEKNHGHAPGLVAKLKAALQHLPKIAPKQGVYQGDMMFTDVDKKTGRQGVSFNPNPSGLTYTATGANAARAKKAKMGLVTHLSYKGKNAASLNASHEVDHENFGQHPDVFTVDPRMDTSKVNFGPKDRAAFNKYISAAENIHNTHGTDMYAGTRDHQAVGGPMETYINHTVRTSETPSHAGFSKWLEAKRLKDIEKLKAEKNRKAKQDDLAKEMKKLQANKRHYDNLFKFHNNLQKAKDVLINTLNQHQEFKHVHAGEPANPEGYVFHHGNETDKLVNRAEFSRRNLTGIRNL